MITVLIIVYFVMYEVVIKDNILKFVNNGVVLFRSKMDSIIVCTTYFANAVINSVLYIIAF